MYSLGLMCKSDHSKGIAIYALLCNTNRLTVYIYVYTKVNKHTNIKGIHYIDMVYM